MENGGREKREEREQGSEGGKENVVTTTHQCCGVDMDLVAVGILARPLKQINYNI